MWGEDVVVTQTQKWGTKSVKNQMIAEKNNKYFFKKKSEIELKGRKMRWWWDY